MPKIDPKKIAMSVDSKKPNPKAVALPPVDKKKPFIDPKKIKGF